MRKNIKNLFMVMLGIILAILLVFPACRPQVTPPPSDSGPSGTTPSDASPTPSSPPVEVINLRFAGDSIPGTSGHKCDEYFLDLVEQKTGGRVKIERFHGNTLGNTRELMTLVRQGGADIGKCFMVFFSQPNEIPLYEAIHAPLWLGIEKGLEGNNRILFDLPETSGLLIEEAHAWGIQPLVLAAASDYGLMAAFDLTSLADMKGKKVNSYGLYDTVKFKELESQIVSIAPPEIYEALSRKLIDCANSGILNFTQFKLQEIGKTFVITQETLVSGLHVMNLETWNSLPPDVQKAFMDARSEYLPWAKDFCIQDREAQIKIMLDAGVKQYELTDKEVQFIRDVQDKVAQELVKIKTEVGLGQKAEAWYKAWSQLR